jgi:hypothetical protein
MLEVKILFPGDADWIELNNYQGADLLDYHLGYTKSVFSEEFKSTKDTLSIKIVYAASLAARLLSETGYIKAQVTKDGSRIFTGVLRPTTDLSLASVRDVIELEIIDNSELLEIPLSTDVSINGAYLCRLTLTTKSIVHSLLAQAAETITTYGLPNLAQTNPGYSTRIYLPQFTATAGETLGDVLAEVLWYYGWSYHFDELGRFRMVSWATDIETATPTVNFDDTETKNIISNSHRIKKCKTDYDSVELEYVKLAVLAQALAYDWPGNGSVLGAMPYATASRTVDLLAPSATSYEKVLGLSNIKFTYRMDYNFDGTADQKVRSWPEQTFPAGGYINSLYYRISGSNAGSKSTINLQNKWTEAYLGIYVNPFVGELRVYADYNLKVGDQKAYSEGTKKRYKKLTTDRIWYPEFAQSFANLYRKNILENAITHYLKSYDDEAVGSICLLTISSRNLTSKGRIIKKTFDHKTREYEYVIRSTSDVALLDATIPDEIIGAGNTGKPARPYVSSIESGPDCMGVAVDGSYFPRIKVQLGKQDNGASYVVSWQAGDETSGDPALVESVEVSTSANPVYLSPVSQGETYLITVRAKLNDILSEPVVYSHQVVGSTGRVDVPTGLAIALDAGGLAITWDSIDGAVFELRVGATDSTWDTSTRLWRGQGTAYTWDFQTAGEYRLWLQCWLAGVPAISPASIATAILGPDNVNGLAAAVIRGTVSLTWTDPDVHTLPLDHYEVWIGPTFAEAVLITSQKGTYLADPRENGTYTYWVRAVDVGGNLGSLDSVQATINVSASAMPNNLGLLTVDPTSPGSGDFYVFGGTPTATRLYAHIYRWSGTAWDDVSDDDTYRGLCIDQLLEAAQGKDIGDVPSADVIGQRLIALKATLGAIQAQTIQFENSVSSIARAAPVAGDVQIYMGRDPRRPELGEERDFEFALKKYLLDNGLNEVWETMMKTRSWKNASGTLLTALILAGPLLSCTGALNPPGETWTNYTVAGPTTIGAICAVGDIVVINYSTTTNTIIRSTNGGASAAIATPTGPAGKTIYACRGFFWRASATNLYRSTDGLSFASIADMPAGYTLQEPVSEDANLVALNGSTATMAIYDHIAGSWSILTTPGVMSIAGSVGGTMGGLGQVLINGATVEARCVYDGSWHNEGLAENASVNNLKWLNGYWCFAGYDSNDYPQFVKILPNGTSGGSTQIVGSMGQFNWSAQIETGIMVGGTLGVYFAGDGKNFRQVTSSSMPGNTVYLPTRGRLINVQYVGGAKISYSDWSALASQAYLDGRIASISTAPPIGYTYWQAPGKSAPTTLWPSTTWTNISSGFAGEFARIEGGNALAFGGGQQGSQNLNHTHYRSHSYDGYGESTISREHDCLGIHIGQTGNFYDDDSSSYTQDHAMTRNDGGGSEARPINRTWRLWERTA